MIDKLEIVARASGDDINSVNLALADSLHDVVARSLSESFADDIEDDDKLTVDAQELKKRLLAIVAKSKEPK